MGVPRLASTIELTTQTIIVTTQDEDVTETTHPTKQLTTQHNAPAQIKRMPPSPHSYLCVSPYSALLLALRLQARVLGSPGAATIRRLRGERDASFED